MLLIGLTGSIATGKSTVSTILSSAPHSLPIIDADVIARVVVQPGTSGHSQIVQYFSPTTPGLLNEDGTLNRAALGRRVFGSGEEKRRDRKVLDGITHPLVRKEMYKQITNYYLHGHWAVVLDIPLLFEASLDLLCGAVLVVAVSSREVQLERLLARDKEAGPGDMTYEEAERRVVSQMPVEEKVDRCEKIYNRGGKRGRGHVLMNDGTVDELWVEVGKVLAGVKEGREGWWKWVLWAFPPLAGVVGLCIVVVNWWYRGQWLAEKEKEKEVKEKL